MTPRNNCTEEKAALLLDFPCSLAKLRQSSGETERSVWKWRVIISVCLEDYYLVQIHEQTIID